MFPGPQGRAVDQRAGQLWRHHGQSWDFIVAEEIGVAVIAAANVEEVLQAAANWRAWEQPTREWAAKGKTVEGLLKEFGRI
jgi:hypothetical protein